MGLIDDIRNYLNQLPPHVSSREAATLLKRAVFELEEREWVSVEVALPPTGKPVQITQHEYEDPAKPRYYDVAIYTGDIWIEDTSGEECYVPTHWAHLQPFPSN